MYLNNIYKNIELQRIKYFMMVNGIKDIHIISVIENKKNKIIQKKINRGVEIINDQIENDDKLSKCVKKYMSKINVYYKDLLSRGKVSEALIILFCLKISFNIKEVIGGEVEMIPENADKKYKIVELQKKTTFNHEGVNVNNKFYYFSPIFFNEKRCSNSIKSTGLLKLLSDQHLKNSVWLRLDENLSVKLEDYKKQVPQNFVLYRGKTINLDNIEFPYHRNNVILIVYNPESMKQIQFKLSSRKDYQKWIEIEEINEFSEQKDSYTTKYLHSIYDENKGNFSHIDGSINYYGKETYKKRTSSDINSHADKHEKLWLVEGNIKKNEWLELIYKYFDDKDLIMDAFNGNLNEGVII